MNILGRGESEGDDVGGRFLCERPGLDAGLRIGEECVLDGVGVRGGLAGGERDNGEGVVCEEEWA